MYFPACPSQPPPQKHQLAAIPDILRKLSPCLLSFCLLGSPSKAGRGVAFLKLARAQRRRWEVLGEFAKYAFCGLKRKRRDFERSVLKYVSIKIPALTHSGRKSRVCVNQPDRLLPPEQSASPPLPFLNRKVLCILPCRRGGSPSGEVGTPVRRAITLVRCRTIFIFSLPFGHTISPSGEVGTPVRRGVPPHRRGIYP